MESDLSEGARTADRAAARQAIAAAESCVMELFIEVVIAMLILWRIAILVSR
jgi:hypothetical protein